MTTNGHHLPSRKFSSESTALVEVNTLSEDDRVINPADHDGKDPTVESVAIAFGLFQV
jgi:hypothetical protein